jgi:sialate O-acetylesterase
MIRVLPVRTTLGILLAVVTTATPVFAEIQLGSPFGSHMVLQCEMKVPVWGTADPAEIVTIDFAGQKHHATADDQGRWRVDLDPLAASTEPRVFTVGGASQGHPIRLEDVVVGEVWLCSGQSNMERRLGPQPGMKPVTNREKEVANANHPLIRQLYVTQRTALAPSRTVKAEWTVCSPETAGGFTAVGYFFARDLHAKTGLPIGIIHSSWGGTPAEAWTSAPGLSNFPEFSDQLAALEATDRDPKKAAQAYLKDLEQWYHVTDPGTRDSPWNAENTSTTDWETMTLPVMWEKAGHPGFDGLVWFRKSVDLPKTWDGSDVELRLSAIDDADTTWVNGTLVGATNDWQKPRAYRVPGAVLKKTGNVIAVRVLDTGGNGGIWNPQVPFEIASLNQSFAPVPLAGPWLCRFAAKLDDKNRPPTNVSESASAPTVLYNGMIAPLVPYALRGVTFYQGEANADRPKQYRTLFPALIADWRAQWGQGNFPFLFVQIAPFREMPPEIREAQLLSWHTTKNTAMVVTLDHGDAEDIHPAEKEPVGSRLALAARALAYHEKLEYSGPVYESMSTRNESAVLHFTHCANGLVAKGGSLLGFTIAGDDGVFHAAHADIDGDNVIVSIPDVVHPAAVRYAWENAPMGNLFNSEDLPASPFRTDVD